MKPLYIYIYNIELHSVYLLYYVNILHYYYTFIVYCILACLTILTIFNCTFGGYRILSKGIHLTFLIHGNNIITLFYYIVLFLNNRYISTIDLNIAITVIYIISIIHMLGDIIIL